MTTSPWLFPCWWDGVIWPGAAEDFGWLELHYSCPGTTRYWNPSEPSAGLGGKPQRGGGRCAEFGGGWGDSHRWMERMIIFFLAIHHFTPNKTWYLITVSLGRLLMKEHFCPQHLSPEKWRMPMTESAEGLGFGLGTGNPNSFHGNTFLIYIPPLPSNSIYFWEVPYIYKV